MKSVANDRLAGVGFQCAVRLEAEYLSDRAVGRAGDERGASLMDKLALTVTAAHQIWV
jgi:hypothetical protein